MRGIIPYFNQLSESGKFITLLSREQALLYTGNFVNKAFQIRTFLTKDYKKSEWAWGHTNSCLRLRYVCVCDLSVTIVQLISGNFLYQSPMQYQEPNNRSWSPDLSPYSYYSVSDIYWNFQQRPNDICVLKWGCIENASTK